MAQWHMGRSERFFDNPMEFRPERWLLSDSQGPAHESVKDVLSPFSLGPRNCLGKMLVTRPEPARTLYIESLMQTGWR